MANTPPKPPIEERSEADLLDELCLELRHVGVSDHDLPDGKRVVQHIHEVSLIHGELMKRKTQITSRINVLSKETSWKMETLLEDCLAFPKRQPYVKELDGIRRTLRCQLCRKAERPPDAKLFWFCESCMCRVVSSLQQKVACDGIVIFRSYTPNSRCSHADADTPLAAESYYSEQIFGVCEKCASKEIERRHTLPSLD
jgi:hypothetical protein